jgi:general secretion pathway protein K
MIRKNQNGIALFIVLWVLTLLSVMVAEFAFATRTAVNMVRNFKEGTQAHYLARSGMNMAVAELIGRHVGGEPVVSGGTFPEDGELATNLRYNVPLPPLEVPGGEIRLHARSVSGQINLNRAEKPLLGMMLGTLDVNDEERAIILDSILDWRDSDNLVRLNGAEDKYYKSLSPSYSSKNGDFDAPEELLRVRGVTREIFEKIRNMLTVFPKSDPDPTARAARRETGPYDDFNFDRLDVNNMPRSLLEALPGMTPDAAEAILRFRETEDFRTYAQLRPFVGDETYAALTRFVAFQSIPAFSVRAEGRLPGTPIRRTVQAVVEIDLTASERFRFLTWRDDGKEIEASGVPESESVGGTSG